MSEATNNVVSNTSGRNTPSELLIIGDAGLESGKSLQDSFLKFRSQKIKERQIMKMCQATNGNGSRSDAFKSALRAKFIDAAKRYLGVPYALRFKAETDEVAPLYLDCCALVRQAVQDLQEDFGFVIGRWNQAYQMDTLPIILKQEELKPGDLIFYEGTYNSNRSKPQKHNNVHVEIFLGGETGEETIGSRYHRGKVSIFPSFKFKSTTWELVQYHFRSIDTWLDGNCRSCCPDHPWQSDSLNYLEAAGKRSIFSTDADDENAGGEEEDETDQAGINDNLKPAGDVAVEMTSCSQGEPEIIVIGGEEDETHQDLDDDDDIVIPEPRYSLDESISPNDLVESVQGNPPPVATAAPTAVISDPLDNVCPLDNLPKPHQSAKDPSKPRRKSASEVAALIEETSASSKAGKPKRNPVTRNSTDSLESATSNSGLSIKKANVSAKDNGVSKSVDLSKGKVSSKDIPKVYYVGKSNGWKLVKAAMDKRGWQQLPFEYQFSSRFGLKWVERRSDIDYRNHVPGQLVCHIPNNDCITTKIGILSVLRDKFCKQSVGSSTNTKTHPPWVPETYDLDIPADGIALIQRATDLANKATTNGETPSADAITSGIWIYKPSCYNRGRGIRVITGIDALKEICYGKQTGDPETTIAPMKGIVQKYIENPLLVGAGFKFDIRCYLLIARNYPSTLAFYHPGYCRLALKPYDISSVTSLADPSVHLTNASIQKKDPIYEANKELQIQSILSVADTIEKGGAPASAEYLRNRLDHEIKLCMVDVLKASNHKFIKKHGYFDLLGCDFMLSSDNKLYLLEINTNPALSLDNSTLEDLLPGVVDGALGLVLGSQGPDTKGTSGDKALLANVPGNFQLLFNEETDYFYK